MLAKTFEICSICHVGIFGKQNAEKGKIVWIQCEAEMGKSV